MRILKKILLWLVIVIVVVSVAAQFIPAHWKVTRATVVNAPRESVYPWLVDIKNWEQWNSFSTKDPGIVHTYRGVTSGVGAQDSWKSKKFGDGNATITKADPNTGIEFELRFDRMAGVAPGKMELIPVEGGTQVIYSVEGWHGHNPVHRIFGLFTDKFLGGFFEESLGNVKRLSETLTPPASAPEASTIP